MRKIVLFLALLVQGTCALWAQTIRQRMEAIQARHKVHFVYDAQLPIDGPAGTGSIESLGLDDALRVAFARTGIAYERRRKNVMLWAEQPAAPPAKPRTYTLRGVVSAADGERLINASVYDVVSRLGVVTNEQGQYALSLPAGTCSLRVSYPGCELQEKEVRLTADRQLNFRLEDAVTLGEVTVVGQMNAPMLTTQTGKRTLTADDIQTEFALLSSPDLVKTIQRFSGVHGGVDLVSGMHVHGGENDENLFLLDGTPLYQTNHLFGLFSTFNADIVKNVDFYKSGFPARYSGRVSSVTDVRTRDGDTRRFRGLFSLGLIEGRLQFEGPIVKDRTSFNFAMRRSWLDLLLRPVYALKYRNYKEGDRYTMTYDFHDVNAKVTHRLNARHTLWLSLYSGLDKFTVNDDTKSSNYAWLMKDQFQWGSLNAALGGDFQFRPALSATLSLVGTHSRSRYDFKEKNVSSSPYDPRYDRISTDHQRVHTQMYDLGARADFRWTPTSRHRVRFGSHFTHHIFRPKSVTENYYNLSGERPADTLQVKSRHRTSSPELTLYAEDEMPLNRLFSANVGLSYTLMHVKGRNYHLLDPRLALKAQVADWGSVKLSYTHMSQSIHRISSSYIDLPSDFWVPSTAKIRPTQSHQLAAGFYVQPTPRLTASVEGFYKRTDHLLQYRNWMGQMPTSVHWDKEVVSGRGRAYGLELDAAYRTPRLTASLAYTLAWSQRLFPELHPEWFYSMHDNRHKLDLTLGYTFSKRVSLYAAWTLRSGNRMTMPVYEALDPHLPGVSTGGTSSNVYIEPNNYSLPMYHRLDLGANFTRITKRGRERIWNVSLYNAYCHFNTMYVTTKQNPDGTLRLKTRGFIPIIPSFSYTIKF